MGSGVGFGVTVGSGVGLGEGVAVGVGLGSGLGLGGGVGVALLTSGPSSLSPPHAERVSASVYNAALIN